MSLVEEVQPYSVEELAGIRIIVGGFRVGKTITARLFATVVDRQAKIERLATELQNAQAVVEAAVVKYPSGNTECLICGRWEYRGSTLSHLENCPLARYDEGRQE